MGHLLSTVNPEAAEAIQPTSNPYPVRRPFIGEMVQYYARPGEGRAGRQKFPAWVMAEPADDGRLELMVLSGVDDMREMRDVRPKSHDQPWHSWAFAPGAVDKDGSIKIVADALFGDHKPVEESVYDMILALGERMKGYDRKILALEDRAKDLEASNKTLRTMVRKLQGKGGDDSAED